MKEIFLISYGQRDEGASVTQNALQYVDEIARLLRPHLQQKQPTLICSPAPLAVAKTEHLGSCLNISSFSLCEELRIKNRSPETRDAAIRFLGEQSKKADTLIVVTHRGFASVVLQRFCESVGIHIGSLDSIDMIASSFGIIITYESVAPSVAALNS